MNAYDFVAKWRKIVDAEQTPGKRAGELKLYQQHFLDLCALVGHPAPAELDPDQAFFMFEAGVVKITGSHGRADVWFKDHFAFEYKDVDGDLDWAYLQLLQYRDSLHNPPLLVTSNFERLVIHPNFTGTQTPPVVVTLDDLKTQAGLEAVRALFYNPNWFRPEQRAIRVTEEAAKTFAGLAEYLGKWGHAPHDVAHYLIRLLFALFAEDIGLLPEGLVTRMVEKGKHHPERFNRQIKQLFAAMAVGDTFGEFVIDWFNGGLFDDDAVVELDADALVILDRVTTLDWSAIEPAILGTLFTRSLDPKQRSRLGAQYTSREDILLIVEPVLMAPLVREWDAVQAAATAAAERRNQASSQKERVQAQKEIERQVDGFFDRLATVRVLDPACGSGNFLYVSLLLLLDLWLEVRSFGGHLGMNMRLPLEGLAPHPRQLYGIEINDYAHELASTTVWIGYLQWLHQHGFGFQRNPVLEPLDNIRQMDAILAYDDAGQPVEPAWPAAEVIVGNPPFLGGNKIRQELGDFYVDRLFALYQGRIPAVADLVCYWFEKARTQMQNVPGLRVGLLSTQAIRGGLNRVVLDRICSDGHIFWAQSDRNWILDGATVHVSMIAFARDHVSLPQLDGVTVKAINPDLTATTDLTKVLPLRENQGICFMGPSPKGPFDIAVDKARDLMDSSANEGGLYNADVVKHVVSGVDIVQRSRNKWTIDFGLMSEQEARRYKLPFAYVEENVYPVRSKNRREAYAKKWWQYAEARPGMRSALKGKQRFIATPEVAKHRVFAWMDSHILCNQQTLVFAREDNYFFGVLHSKAHELWARRTGTQLREAESGFRYTPTTTFETYPFPWPPGQEPVNDPRVEAIAAAARDLVAQRDEWLNPPGLAEPLLAKRTLTNLYNERPAWLAAAHARLDAAVLAAYGWPADLEDEEVLARLLALNLERAGQGPG